MHFATTGGRAMVLCLALGAAACTSGPSTPSATATPRPASPGPSAVLGAPGCHPASPIRSGPSTDSGERLPEVQGTGHGAELWGLLMQSSPYPPLRTGTDLKIVWRMTGSGDLRLSVTRPDGRAGPLVFGPEPHSGSSYSRPGDEWGTGFRLTQRGCWHLRAARGSATAEVWLSVAARR